MTEFSGMMNDAELTVIRQKAAEAGVRLVVISSNGLILPGDLTREEHRNIGVALFSIHDDAEHDAAVAALTASDLRLVRLRRPVEQPKTQRRLPLSMRPGFIYFLRDDEAAVIKIGFSFNPVRRSASLRSSHPRPLTQIGTIPGTLREERRLHNSLGAYRLGGEWYWATREFEKLIAKMIRKASQKTRTK